MIVNHNNLNLHRLNTIQTDLSVSMPKLTSGYRLEKTAIFDTAVIDKLRGQMEKTYAPIKFHQDNVSLMQTAHGALSETSSILMRMKELATQARSDIHSGTDRTTLQEEFDKLSKEITQIGDGTSFNGHTLLNGSKEVQTESAAFGPENRYVKLNDMRAEALGVADLSLASTDSLENAFSKIDEALNLVHEQRNVIRQEEDYLSSKSMSVISNSMNSSSLENRIRDSEMARDIVNSTKQKILEQANSLIFSQANSIPQSVLTLLRG